METETTAIEPNGLAPEAQNPTNSTNPTPDPARQALEAENKQLREQADKARGYAIALTQRLAQMEQSPVRTAPEIPDDQRQEAIKRSLDDDPEGTLDAHFQQRIAPMMRNQHQTLAQLNRDHFISKVGADAWKKYQGEIEQFVSNLPNKEETMSQPGAWENAYNFVRINHIDDIVEERMRQRSEEQQKRVLLEGESATGAGSSGQSRGLTELEKHMMQEFGMNEKEWRAYGAKNLTGPVAQES